MELRVYKALWGMEGTYEEQLGKHPQQATTASKRHYRRRATSNRTNG